YLKKRRLESGRLEAGDATSCAFRVGEFSPWLKVNHLAPDRSEKGWCRLVVIPGGRSRSDYVLRFSHTLFAAGDTDVAFTYPGSLADSLQERFGYYFPSSWLDKPIIPEFTADATRYASYFYEYEDWDLFLYVFTQTDNIQHLDGVTPITRQVYQIIDRHLARLLDRLPEDSTLIIASDHGFKEYSISIDLNRLFQQLGLLSYASGPEIDFEKTLVFHNLWCVYFNRDLLDLEELNRRGIETPAGMSADESLIRYLRRAGRGIKAGARGTPYPIEFCDVAPGAIGHAPDLIVKGTYGDYHVEFWNLKRPRDAVLRALGPDEKWNHTREGIVMAYGKGVRRGVELPEMEIADITPTMLYLLGLPTPADMDGRIMAEAFESRALARRPHYVIEDLGVLSRGESVSDEERETLERSLRSLGYIR
ncbi:alkaline phosphatase family protein, partial [bacterium]|nr:alkaline phosphatase family protein [bacterium]